MASDGPPLSKRAKPDVAGSFEAVRAAAQASADRVAALLIQCHQQSGGGCKLEVAAIASGPNGMASSGSAASGLGSGSRISLMRKEEQRAPEEAPHQAGGSTSDAGEGAGEGADGIGKDQETLYEYARVAEEAAQFVLSAAALCQNTLELSQVPTIASHAEQAALRAAWAVSIVLAYEPSPSGSKDNKEWVASLKVAVDKWRHIAETSVNEVRAALAMYSESSAHVLPDTGATRSLDDKRAELCVFFAAGKCSRGETCSFAHGREEMAIISQMKASGKGGFKGKKGKGKGGDGRPHGVLARPGDWCCSICGHYMYASKNVCYKCNRSRTESEIHAAEAKRRAKGI